MTKPYQAMLQICELVIFNSNIQNLLTKKKKHMALLGLIWRRLPVKVRTAGYFSFTEDVI